MKKYILIITIISFLLSGCLATKPPEVSKSLLTEISASEIKVIEDIEKKIISIKEEEDKTKKLISVYLIRNKINDFEITIGNERNELFKERKKLYNALDDNISLENLNKEIIKNESERNIIRYKGIYLTAKYEDLISYLKVKEAELALEIATKLYKEAQFAKKYQITESASQGSDTSENQENEANVEDFDLAEYKEYLNGKKMNLINQQKERKKNEKLSEISRNDLLKTGFKLTF